MKKRFFSIMMIVSMLMLTACGKSDAEKYVKLGDYSDLSVDVTYMTYTDEDVMASVEDDLKYYVEMYDLYDYVPSDETVVTQGSLVNIDYVGKLDGVAFDGGTDTGAHLEIGSGSFIDGFESGLEGKQVGETVDLNLTFPAEYHSAELAGKEVVFTVSINSIDTRNMPEYTDEFITSLGLDPSITSYDAYVEYTKNTMQSSCDYENEMTKQSALFNAVYEISEVSDPPQELIDKQYDLLIASYEDYATQYGIDLETLVSYQGMDMATFEADCQSAAVEAAKAELVYQAIAEKEGIEVTDDIVMEVAQAECDKYDYESVEWMMDYIGEDAYKDYVLRLKVLEKLEEVITIVETEPISMMNVQ